ncbi:hypothetical protein NIES2109_63380 (plasmid) [Nostoc sp. HK-01]|nr:hypothetical protein NIES2109_63380 [Nostoc sp. HK-01]
MTHNIGITMPKRVALYAKFALNVGTAIAILHNLLYST